MVANALTTAERVRKIVSDHFDRSFDAENVVLSDIDGIDSLDNLELTMAVQEEFGIELPDADLEGVETLADAIALVERELGKVPR